ncbi:hypothetical protein B0H11DRAFT_2119286 [Mycena galericulata]|nr:hypothetical protein B0H11DRAFT_2119286 [Mycena galericulata]
MRNCMAWRKAARRRRYIIFIWASAWASRRRSELRFHPHAQIKFQPHSCTYGDAEGNTAPTVPSSSSCPTSFVVDRRLISASSARG